MLFAWYLALFNYLTVKTYPKDATKVIKQKVRRHANKYYVQEDQLMEKETHKQVLHDANAREVLVQVHEESHLGFKQLYTTAKQHFIYQGKLTPICKSITSDCITCQMRARVARIRRNPARPIKTPHSPFFMVAVDAVGPIEVTSSKNRYLLTGIDYLTRWPFAKAVPDINEVTTTEFYFETMVCHYGVPNYLLSDRGSNFISTYTKSFLSQIGCRAVNTTSYRAQTNGLCENLNRNLCRTIAKLARDKNDIQEWDKYLNKALLALRTLEGTSTRYSPSQLLYGFQMMTPGVWAAPITGYVEGEYEEDVAKRVAFIDEELQKIRENARLNSDKAKAKAALQYNKKVFYRKPFEIGEQVLLKVNVSSKFEDKWQGPYTIRDIGRFGSDTYYLQGPRSVKIKSAVNGDQLKPFVESKYMIPDIGTSRAYSQFKTWVQSRPSRPSR